MTRAAPIPVRAVLLGERLDVRGAARALRRVAEAPTVVRVGDGWVALFRYGAIVSIGLAPEEERELHARLRRYVEGELLEPEEEETAILVRPDAPEGPDPEGIVLRGTDPPRLQAVAEVLAKSVALAHVEESVAEAFDRVEPMAARLERGRPPGPPGGALYRHVGVALRARQRAVGAVEVEDLPDFVWERPDVERLYRRLREEYELLERNVVLGKKLDVIGQTAETLLSLATERRMIHLEAAIVALIVLEILLTLRDLLA